MQELRSSIWLVADFFFPTHRISGRVNVRTQKLIEQLTDTTTDYLAIEDAYISSILNPAAITTSYEEMLMRKSNVTCVIVTGQLQGVMRDQSYGNYYYGVTKSHVYISIPSFEVEGNLRIPGKTNLRTFLAPTGNPFVILEDGTLKSPIRPDVTFTADIILVNKDHIGAFCKKEAQAE